MTTEVVEQVAAALHGLVYIEAGNRTCRTCSHVAGACDYHCRAVIYLGEARCYNTYDTTVPVGVEDYDGAALVKALEPLDNAVGLLGHAFVELLACLVHLVYLMAHCYCSLQVVLNEQIDSHLALLYTARSVYTWSNLEDYIVDVYLLLIEAAHIDYGLEADTWAVVELLYAVESQNAVLAHYGHEIRCYAHGYKVKQRIELVGGNAVVHCKSLHELEAHTATREVRIGVG